jgi:predicted nucleic acid-binding protein
MPDGPVVLNNTPLVALWNLGRLDLLETLFGDILIPRAVHEEFLAASREERRKALAAARFLHVADLADPRRALAYAGLHRGEAQVIALAEERAARLVVLDDRRARRYAERLGFPRTGTLGVLLLAKERGLVRSVAAEITRLQEAGLYLGPTLIAKARELAGE